MRLLDDGLWILESFNNILNGVFLSSSGLSPPFFSSSFGRVSNIIITIIEITAIKFLILYYVIKGKSK